MSVERGDNEVRLWCDAAVRYLLTRLFSVMGSVLRGRYVGYLWRLDVVC